MIKKKKEKKRKKFKCICFGKIPEEIFPFDVLFYSLAV